MAALTPDEVLALWQRVVAVKAIRAADPGLFDAVLRAAGKVLDKRTAREISDALEHSHPAAVLNAYWRQLLPDRPAVGAYLLERAA